jgi:hypothetical protein
MMRERSRDRRPNAELRPREHLTPGEVDSLIEAAKANRHGLGSPLVPRHSDYDSLDVTG